MTTMGWTSQNRRSGISAKEYWTNEFSDGYEVLDVAQVKRNTVYAAIRHPEGYVFGFVALQQWNPTSYHNFACKTMDESCGPNESECPERILKLLSPLEDMYDDLESGGGLYAKQWRERCQDNLDRRAAAKKVKVGDIVTFAHPLHFYDGSERTEFTYLGKNRFSDKYGYGRYSIRNWRTRNFSFFTPSEDDPRYNDHLAELLSK
jgi:hypothetical protein